MITPETHPNGTNQQGSEELHRTGLLKTDAEDFITWLKGWIYQRTTNNVYPMQDLSPWISYLTNIFLKGIRKYTPIGLSRDAISDNYRQNVLSVTARFPNPPEPDYQNLSLSVRATYTVSTKQDASEGFRRIDMSAWPTSLLYSVRQGSITGHLQEGTRGILTHLWQNQGRPTGDFDTWLETQVYPSSDIFRFPNIPSLEVFGFNCYRVGENRTQVKSYCANREFTQLFDVLWQEILTVFEMVEHLPDGIAEPKIAHNIFRQKDDIWEIAFNGGDIFLCKHLLGLAYIHYLLKYPNKPINVKQLQASQSEEKFELTSSTEIIELDINLLKGGINYDKVFDDEYMKNIKDELERLREERKEAEEIGDSDKIQTINKEVNNITGIFNAGRGLGGKSRYLNQEEEKIRLSVYKAIKKAYSHLEKYDLLLSKYLIDTIKTGLECSYLPKKRTDINPKWAL